jgi:hypothetical protein
MNKKKARRLCKTCGLEVNRLEKVYCNNICQQLHRWQMVKTEINTTGILPPRIRVAKRYLHEKDGIKCSKCAGVMWFDKPIPLVFDHIDGNSDNWSMDNCRLICPNCDTFTPFYKGKNKGNGRFCRRRRYKEGKSF